MKGSFYKNNRKHRSNDEKHWKENVIIGFLPNELNDFLLTGMNGLLLNVMKFGKFQRNSKSFNLFQVLVITGNGAYIPGL